MDAAEYLDKADAVERPFLDGKVEFLNPMLICAAWRITFNCPRRPGSIKSDQQRCHQAIAVDRQQDPARA
jgi:hypothetical protein